MTRQVPGSRFLTDDFGNIVGVQDHDGDEHAFVFGNPAWTDIDFPIIVRTTGPNIPTLANLRAPIQAPQWAVNDNAQIEGQEMIHAWIEGTPGQWHVHFITNGVDTTDRFLKFQLDWCFASPNTQLSALATVTSADLLIPANTPDRTHFIVFLGEAAMPAAKIATHVWAKLTRVSAAGAAPTGAPFITMLQMHVQVDGTGSRTQTTK